MSKIVFFLRKYVYDRGRDSDILIFSLLNNNNSRNVIILDKKPLFIVNQTLNLI